MNSMSWADIVEEEEKSMLNINEHTKQKESNGVRGGDSVQSSVTESIKNQHNKFTKTEQQQK